MDQNKQDQLSTSFSGSLEQPETVIEPSAQPVAQPKPVAATPNPGLPHPTFGSPIAMPNAAPAPEAPKSPGALASLLRRINIFLVLFIILIIGAAVAVYVSYRYSKSHSTAQTNTVTQNLTADQISKLSSGNVEVGDSQQQLTIASATTFNSKVLVRNDLDISGSLHIGGSVSLPSLTVAGKSTFDSLQISKDLAVAGNFAVQGSISTQGSLTIAGNASFGGTVSAPNLTVDKLTLTGDFVLNKHLSTGGGAPSISNGASIGNGGTVSINGSDTAGTVTINTGGSPAAGTLANITFAQSFGSKPPRVVISPVGNGGAGIGYYVTRSGSGFSIACINVPAGGSSFSFDYIVIN